LDIQTITTLQTLDRIARSCPRALSTFVHLLCRVNNEGKVSFRKEQIINDLSESYAKFRNDIRSLARENLLEWHQKGTSLHVTLALPDVDIDGA
jgi:hypothetical protein